MSDAADIRVPLFIPDLGDAEKQAALQCISDGWVAQGPRCQQFEAALCTALGVQHATVTSSCTSALHIAMLLVGAGHGDEVIVPSLTFAATANAVLYTGAKPVFADVTGFEDWTIDPEEIQKRITAKTKAIVPMHYAGFPCDMDAILSIAREHGIAVIEDACHGLGGRLGGHAMGTMGDIGCFSFYSNKVITCGEGGALVTNNGDFHQRAVVLRSHGMTAVAYDRMKGAMDYDIAELGYNYRMDDLRASIGLVQLDRMGEFVQRKTELASLYRDLLQDVDGVSCPDHGARGQPAHYILPVLLERGIDRDAVRAAMMQDGIQTSMHYPPAHLFGHIADAGAQLPHTETIGRQALTLPLYPRLSEAQAKAVVLSLDKAIRACS